MLVFLDFETVSDVDLRIVGTTNYINHPSTRVSIVSYKTGGKLTSVFIPTTLSFDDPIDLVAHNCFFELSVIKKFFPSLKINKVIDTMALASYNNIRRALNTACADLRIPERKHEDGKFVMHSLNRGKKLSELTEDQIKDYIKYCEQDVLLCEEIYNKLISKFPQSEQDIYDLTLKYNFLGLPIDVKLATMATAIMEDWKDKVPEMISDMTGGYVTSINQVGRLATFLKQEAVTAPFLRERLVNEKDKNIISVIRLRLEGGKKSVSKFSSCLSLQHQGRLYNVMDYHAAATGRYSSRGVQLQNLLRAEKTEADDIIHKIKSSGTFPFDQTPSYLSRAVRGLIVPPAGHDLIKADYSQIEARILAVLSGDRALVSQFQAGDKIYEKMAAKIFNIPLDQVTEKQRFYGKSAVLGCGYGMGTATFSKTYKLPEDISKRCVTTYRLANHLTVKLWKNLEACIVKVVSSGESAKFGSLNIYRDSWRLFIHLPSGRDLVYPYPEIVDGRVEHYSRKRGGFMKCNYWGGTFVENICQALSRDLLVSAMFELDKSDKFTFMFTVHDELVYSAKKGSYSLSEFEDLILSSKPRWAKHIPLGLDCETHDRYFK